MKTHNNNTRILDRPGTFSTIPPTKPTKLSGARIESLRAEKKTLSLYIQTIIVYVHPCRGTVTVPSEVSKVL